MSVCSPRTPKLYYVAGPFSAESRDGVELNIREARGVGLKLAELGLFPVVPHDNTSDPRYEMLQDYKFWIAGTLALLKACDAVVTVPGWESSNGARGEVAWAEGRTGWKVVQWFYAAKRLLTGVGRIPVFHLPGRAAAWGKSGVIL